VLNRCPLVAAEEKDGLQCPPFVRLAATLRPLELLIQPGNEVFAVLLFGIVVVVI